MEIQFTAKNLKASETAKNYLRRKLGRITGNLPSVLETKVEITKQKAKSTGLRYRVQVTIDSNGTFLRGDETAATLYKAIDSVVEVMARQAERYKGRLYYKGRIEGRRSSARNAPTAEALTEEEPQGKVVRVKRFEVKPMSLDEAREQMELLGHDFFLFLNDESGEFNLLYRRKDGQLGLIEPKLA